MKLLRKLGATSEIWQIFIADSSSTTGAGLTGLVFNTSSLVAYYHRDTDTTATAISLVTMTVGTFTSSGFKEIDATNMPGWYQFCPPNAAIASGAKSCAFHLKGATNMAPLPIEVDLDGQVDVTSWNGTAVSSPATAGIPDVNVKNINNVATTSVTTINANIGMTQPVNFTGTAGSALVKSDMVDIAGAAVSTTSAQIGVNVVNINAQTASAAAGVTFPSSIASPTNITAGTITTATNLTNAPTAGDFTATMKTSIGTAVAASAVASVTGNVGGNVTGSVGSVVGAVGSVTGNVGGNVTGSVASVVAAVAITSNVKKNQALAGFTFLMTDSTTHTPKTGVTVTATRSLDGGAFGACANSATEISSGWYKIDLAATDLNANVISLRFTGTAADDRDIQLVSQP